jgi:hypothetical protein
LRQSSLWAIELSALLVAAGIARRPVEPSSGEGALVERGDRRGGLAEGPFEIPALGWKDILLRVYNGISQDRILANAGVTYYALLALVSGIAALVSIYGLFADPNTIVSPPVAAAAKRWNKPRRVPNRRQRAYRARLAIAGTGSLHKSSLKERPLREQSRELGCLAGET